MTITDTRTDPATLADPVTAMCAMLTHDSAVVRHAALTIVQQGNARLSPDDCLFVYSTQGWQHTRRGEALLDLIDRHYVATAVQLYAVADLPYTPPRQFMERYPQPRILPEPRTWPAWFWVLGGVALGIVLAIMAQR